MKRTEDKKKRTKHAGDRVESQVEGFIMEKASNNVNYEKDWRTDRSSKRSCLALSIIRV